MKVGRKQQHGGRGQIARRFGSLPPSTERIMERYQGKPLVKLGLSKIELRGEGIVFTRQRL